MIIAFLLKIIYYIFIYSLPFTTIYYSFITSFITIQKFVNIYYHLVHLLQMVYSFTTIYSIYNGGNL